MRYLIIGIVLFLAWSAGSTYWYVCKIKGLCPVQQTAEPQVFGDLPATFALANEAEIIWESDKLLMHRVGEVGAILPEDFPFFASVLAEYWDLHPSYQLVIIGLADPKESDQAESLALLRADDLKSKLEQYNRFPAAIQTEGQLADLLYSREGLCAEAIHWNWRELHAPDTLFLAEDSQVPELDTLVEDPAPVLTDPVPPVTTQPDPSPVPAATYIPTPVGQAPGKRTILFSFAKPEIANPADMDRYIQSVIAYLQAHPDRKVRISGHTDDTASREANLRLGQKRADLIAQMFRDKGLAENRMIVESVGEQEPVASNDTREGRAMNRRTDIEIR